MPMSEVTVEAIQPVLGLDVGSVVTIECTRRVAAAIDHGHLIEVESGELVDGNVDVVRQIAVDVVRPAASATKTTWETYAEQLGLGPSGLTKDQIIALVEGYELADALLDSDEDADIDGPDDIEGD